MVSIGSAGSLRAAPPEGVAAPAARIAVDASALGDSADVVADKIADGAALILDSNGVRTVQDPSAPEVVLRVSPLPGDNPGYRVDYEVRVGGETVEGSGSVSDCRLCTEGELVETAQAAVEMQLPRVRSLQPEPEPEPEPAAGVVPAAPIDDVTPTGGTRDAGPKTGLDRLGKAGIGVGAAGAGALAAGIVLAVLPDKPQPAAKVRTTKLPGIVVAAGGGAALITGVVLIVVDRKQAKRRAGVTAVVPSVGGRFSGLALSGRF